MRISSRKRIFTLLFKSLPIKDKPKPRKLKLVKPSYQPSKVELEADLQIDAIPEDAVEALLKSMEIEYVENPDET